MKNFNDLEQTKIKIVDTDKIGIMKKKSRTLGNGEEMKIVFFD
jgi:hypothetical protein